MNFIDLFAGIGGFSLGLERAGMTCIGQVEIDEFCNKVLQKHWPLVKRVGDIHDVTKESFGSARLICAGYPCQPDSSAGKRRGTGDDRWLWPEVVRILKLYKPDWFVGENVINHENMGLRVVISDLERIGYKVRPFVIPNAAFGLQTLERHIWITAASTRIRFEGCEEKSNKDFGSAWKFQGTDQGARHRWYLPESRVCRTHKGVSDWVDRIKALGNAIPPQGAEIIGKAILETDKWTMN